MVRAQRGTVLAVRGRAAGFTLVELMIVVAVIAILSAIVYPNYREYVVKARRTAVAGCLQQHAQTMERYYTTNLTYVGAPAPRCDADLAAFYQVGFQGGDPTARAYILQAVPTSSQKDPKCGTLTVNAQGVRTKSGTATVADCW
jgi:type IV pilus assembly protein PilE